MIVMARDFKMSANIGRRVAVGGTAKEVPTSTHDLRTGMTSDAEQGVVGGES